MIHVYTKKGLGVFLIFAFVHFFARDITLSSSASWGNQIEATGFYNNQKSLEAICGYLMLLGVGMMLIGLWEKRNDPGKHHSVRGAEALCDDEKAGFELWVAGDASRKHYSKKAQVEMYRKTTLKEK